MPELPKMNGDSPTIAAIYSAIKKTESAQRGYLGASIIGHECERFLWMNFRWAGKEDFNGRMLRLFETGHIEEARLIKNLRDAGLEVWDKDPETNGQFQIIGVDGHFQGHADGVCLGVVEAPKTPHLIEAKTSSLKLFEKLKSEGVEKAKPVHVAQCQIYMHELHLDRTLYIAICKDDERIYIERINYDKSAAMQLLDRAARIVKSVRPPEKIGGPDHPACKYCCHADRCHGSPPPSPAVPVDVTCRSCVHSTPVIGKLGLGAWKCEKHNRTLSEADQRAACPDHLFIPDLVTFAEVVDGNVSENWTEYQNPDGKLWRNGQRFYQSNELAVLPHPMIGDPMVTAVKDHLGGIVVESDDALSDPSGKGVIVI